MNACAKYICKIPPTTDTWTFNISTLKLATCMLCSDSHYTTQQAQAKQSWSHRVLTCILHDIYMRGYAFSLRSRPHPQLHLHHDVHANSRLPFAYTCMSTHLQLPSIFNRSRNLFQNRSCFRLDDRFRKPHLHYIMNNTRRKYFCCIWRSISVCSMHECISG